MSYYADLSSLVKLVEDLICHQRYPNSPLGGLPIVKSLHEKLKSLQELLEDYSSTGDEEANNVESRIRDVVYHAQEVIELEIYHEMHPEKPGHEIHPQRSHHEMHPERPCHEIHPERPRPTKNIFSTLFCFKCPLQRQESNAGATKVLVGVSASRSHMQTFNPLQPQVTCESSILSVNPPSSPLNGKSLDPSLQERSLELLQATEGIIMTQELLQVVEQKISPLVEQLVAMKERQRTKYLNCHSHDTCASESSSIGKNTVVGFDQYLTTIKDQLCGQSSQLQVIPITGTGGIGKTTLARTIFNDSLILHNFDYRGWVTISQHYVVERVLDNLTKSLGITSENILGEHESALKESIYKYLKGRRFLIIVDDIWSTQVWDDLKWLFPDDHNGSRIVLTSRLVDVAVYSSTSGNHHAIQFLNADDSWNLLQEKVFAGESCPFELEITGKLIAKKCQGLPLAIVVTAGILSNTRTQNGWKRVAINLSSILNENEDGLSSLLSLSYNHLPHKLKPCFLYIGTYPEDFEIRISRLMLLWIAEGLIESSGGSKSLENVAEEYLQDLVNRNLVLVNKKKSSGSFKFCTVHDLLRDFCRHEALHENFTHVITQASDSWPRNVRRLNLHCYSVDWQSSNTSSSVRSIIWYHGPLSCGNTFSGFKLLKILDLHASSFSESIEIVCSESIELVCQLFHLKYLAFTNVGTADGILVMPRTISNLQNLETLIVSGYLGGMVWFPGEIWGMPQLRHLKIHHPHLPPIPSVAATGVLECLQTLSVVKNFRFTDEAIRMIPSLLKLKIICLNDDPNQWWNSYHLYNLSHLHRLEKLSIYFRMKYKMESLPANFAFPLNLTKLCLRGCSLPWKDLTVVGCLPNLQVLKLRESAFMGKEWEPTEGEFCSLKFLLLEGLNLKLWLADNTHFPCLEHLVIRSCIFLKEIPLEIGDIPTLKVIEVRYANRGVLESAMRIQEEQQELGNDEIQVHIYGIGE